MLSPKEGPHHGPVKIEIKGDQGHTEIVERFKRDKGIKHVLAFSGGADDDNPVLKYVRDKLPSINIPSESQQEVEDLMKSAVDGYVSSIIRSILEPMRGYRLAVLSGGTKWGVPRVAIQVARECGFPTIGVYPQLAEKKHSLGPELLDLSVCVHPQVYKSNWGDEASTFTKLLDSVVVIGGGSGTLVEVTKILKLNERDGIPVKHIVPIYGTGGAADRIQSFPGKLKTMALCLPPNRISSGDAARDYLCEHVLNDDIYEPLESA